MRTIIGHETIREQLVRIAKMPQAPQSFFLAGPQHVGKRMVALWFARELMGVAEDIADPLDLLKIAPEVVETTKQSREKSIPVEVIRELKHFLSRSPSIGKRRVVMIDKAEKLSTEAANALLKILEEPPHSSALILITSKPEHLPATRLSRLFPVSFRPLSSEVLRKAFPEARDPPQFFFDHPVIEEIAYKNGMVISANANQYIQSGSRVDLLASYAFNKTLGSFTTSVDGITFSTPYEKKVDYLAYDTQNGNLLEYKAADGIVNSFIWSYNDKLPIVHGVGIGYTLLNQAHTSALSSGTYGSSAYENSLRNNSNVVGKSVTTYLHNPQVGILRATDPSLLTKSFEYDQYARLKKVLDNDSKTLEQYQYHFKEVQPTRILSVSGLSIMGEIDFEGQARQHGIPVHLFFSTHDSVIKPALGERMQQHAPDRISQEETALRPRAPDPRARSGHPRSSTNVSCDPIEGSRPNEKGPPKRQPSSEFTERFSLCARLRRS